MREGSGGLACILQPMFTQSLPPGGLSALLLAPHCLLPVPSSVALWGLSKKRPLALQREAHGLRGEPGLEQPFWVSSVAALLNTDLVATGEHHVAEEGPPGVPGAGAHRLSVPPGSHSSCVRLWQCGEGFRRLDPLCDIPLVSGT